MKKEHPKPFIVRFYKHQMKYIKKLSKESRVSAAEVVRLGIDMMIDYEKRHGLN